MRREPAAVLMALVMDSERRELYVEGTDDVAFIQWLTNGSRRQSARIVPIDLVSVRVDSGGNRARIVELAKLIDSLGYGGSGLCFLVDRDLMDWCGTPAMPPRVVTTDGVDLESYLLTLASFEKVLKMGMRKEMSVAAPLLDSVMAAGRELLALRIYDHRQGLSLPFKRTAIGRHVDVNEEQVTLRMSSYCRALLQNAKISLTRETDVLNEAEQVRAELSNECVHGKDAFDLFEAWAKRHGCHCAQQLLWVSVEPGWMTGHPNLDIVMRFLA